MSIRKLTDSVFSQLLDRGYLRLECMGCTPLATVTASRFYLLIPPHTASTTGRVPCTRHDIFGVLVDQDAKTLAIMTIKHGGWREAGRGDMRKG